MRDYLKIEDVVCPRCTHRLSLMDVCEGDSLGCDHCNATLECVADFTVKYVAIVEVAPKELHSDP